MDKLLLKPNEVAETLRIGRSKVYSMLATGELPSIRVGHCIRVPKASLEKWISDQEKVRGGDKAAGLAPAPAASRSS
jgi:excisionase family DNA binding protein